jgi:hypothetical protein
LVSVMDVFIENPDQSIKFDSESAVLPLSRHASRQACGSAFQRIPAYLLVTPAYRRPDGRGLCDFGWDADGEGELALQTKDPGGYGERPVVRNRLESAGSDQQVVLVFRFVESQSRG